MIKKKNEKKKKKKILKKKTQKKINEKEEKKKNNINTDTVNDGRFIMMIDKEFNFVLTIIWEVRKDFHFQVTYPKINISSVLINTIRNRMLFFPNQSL